MSNRFAKLENGWWKSTREQDTIWVYINRGTAIGFIIGEVGDESILDDHENFKDFAELGGQYCRVFHAGSLADSILNNKQGWRSDAFGYDQRNFKTFEPRKPPINWSEIMELE